MVDLRKNNGGGVTECRIQNADQQKQCIGYDDRQRRDGAQYCFRFRDYGYNFWLCDQLTPLLTTG